MIYAIPMMVLVLTILGFFYCVSARVEFGHANNEKVPFWQRVLGVVVALPLAGSAVFVHFIHPALAVKIIPPVLPYPYLLVLLSGVFELLAAVALQVPRLRRGAALFVAVMMVAISPANIYAAGMVIEGMTMPSITVRTAIQMFYIVLALLAGYGMPQATGQV